MSEALAINRPEVVQRIGQALDRPYRLGDCFEIDGRNWDPSVKALPMGRQLEDGWTLQFEVGGGDHPDWPVLVLTPDRGVAVLGHVPEGWDLLAVCFGVRRPRPKSAPSSSLAA